MLLWDTKQMIDGSSPTAEVVDGERAVLDATSSTVEANHKTNLFPLTPIVADPLAIVRHTEVHDCNLTQRVRKLRFADCGWITVRTEFLTWSL